MHSETIAFLNESSDRVKKNYIFGAKATAAGLHKVLRKFFANIPIDAFLVSKEDGNPDEIWGCSVKTVDEINEELSDDAYHHKL